MKIDIYLADEKLEIDETFSMTIEYVYSLLHEPTTLTGDGSKSIAVKGTPHNNRILGQIWRFDRTIYGDDGSKAGNVRIYFNPSKRTPCVIVMNGELFDRGYMRLDQIIIKRGGDIEYSMTFFSEMVDILRTLQSKKLRDLPFAKDLRHTLNAAEVLARYYSDTDGLRYIMVSNGLYEDFESSRWLTKSGTTFKVVDIRNEIQFDETAMCQYRSYYQRPALRVKTIIDLIAQENGIQLDPAFFNASNPYYQDSVLALSQYKVTEQEDAENGFTWFGDLPTEEVPTDGTAKLDILPSPMDNIGLIGNPLLETLTPYTKADGTPKVFSKDWEQTLNLAALNKQQAKIAIEFEYRWIVNVKTDVPPDYIFYYAGIQIATKKPYYFPRPYIKFNDGTRVDFVPEGIKGGFVNVASCLFRRSGANKLQAQFRYRPEAYPNYAPNNNYGWMPMRWVSVESVQDKGKGVLGFFFESDTAHLGEDVIMPSRLYGIKDNISNGIYVDVSNYSFEIRPITQAPTNSTTLNNYYPASSGFTGVPIVANETYALRSNAIVDKNDMLDDEFTQGDFLVNYVKLFGLILYTDPDGTPHIVTRNTFFKSPRIIDWSDKVDYSQNIETQPVPFDAQYYSMKYASGETYYEELYSKNNGLEFGEQCINTGYQFNEETKDMIKDIPFQNTVMSKERTRMLIGVEYIVQNDEKVLPAMFSKDGNERSASDTKYNLLFYNGAKNLKKDDNGETLQPYTVTDDDDHMLKAAGGGKYCWVDVDKVDNPATLRPYVKQMTYPQYSTVSADGRFSWHIGYPRENYAGYDRNTFLPNSTIFANFWQKYIAEIYNADNRIMTAYVYLTAAEVKNWSFADFVVIDGVLWHPNRFIDFNPTDDRPTRVEMIRVSSNAAIVEAYSQGQTDMSAPEQETEE